MLIGIVCGGFAFVLVVIVAVVIAVVLCRRSVVNNFSSLTL